MPTAGTEWINDLTLSQEPNREEVLGFFGIPPAPEEELERNIAKKRRTWNAKKRERKLTPNAERKVDGALKLIETLSQMVIGGVDEEIDLSALDAAATALTGFSTVIELWAYVDELLADGAIAKAVEAARDGISRYGTDPDAQAAFAYVMAQAAPLESDEALSQVMAAEGLAASSHALGANPSSDAPWGIEDAGQWYAQFSIELGRSEDALNALNGVEERSGVLPPMLKVMRGKAFAHLGQDEEARHQVIEAVREVPEDARVCGAGGDVMFRLAVDYHLPISSAQELQKYRDTIEVAAWCVRDIPEAEAIVRPCRLWARQAAGRAFVGNLGRKALVSLLSGFALAPIVSRLESKPVWKVFFDGPGKCSPDTWFQATGNGLAGFVNAGVLDSLPWFSEFASAGVESVQELPATGADSSAGSKSTPWIVIGILILLGFVLGIENALQLVFFLIVVGLVMTVILALTSRLIPGGRPEVTLSGTSPDAAVPEVVAAVTSARDEYLGFPSGIFVPSEVREEPIVVVAKEHRGKAALAPKFHKITGANPLLFLVGLAGYVFYSLPVKLTYWLARVIMTSHLEALLSPTTTGGEEACLVKMKFAGPSGRIAGASFLDSLLEPLLPEKYRSAEESAEGKERSRGLDTIKIFLGVNAAIYLILLVAALRIVLGN